MRYDLDEIFELARKTAELSPCKFQVACILVDQKGNIVSTGYNHHSSGPKMGQRTVHAEMDALKGMSKTAGNLTAFIYRNNGNPINPCSSCRALLNAYHIRAVYCMNMGDWVKEIE
jgi:deoxycytidylate deaminase